MSKADQYIEFMETSEMKLRNEIARLNIELALSEKRVKDKEAELSARERCIASLQLQILLLNNLQTA